MNIKIPVFVLLLSLILTACAETSTITNESALTSSQGEPMHLTLSNTIAMPDSNEAGALAPSGNKSEADGSQNAESKSSSSSIPAQSSAAESAPASSISVTITCDNPNGEHSEKTFTDKDTVDAIIGYFSELSESSIEMTPKTGGDVFTISISNNDKISLYRFNSPQRDGTLYCKDISSTDWTTMTGWLVVSDAGAYDYVADLFLD